MTNKPDPQLAEELYALVEADQGRAYISDGIGNLPRAEILAIARRSIANHQACIRTLQAFVGRFDVRCSCMSPSPFLHDVACPLHESREHTGE